MSKSFKNTESSKNRNPNAAYKLDDDVLEGFKTAARNNQPRLAMEYLVYVLDVIDEKLAALTDGKEVVKPQPAAKKVAKATTETEASASEE